MRRKKIWDDFKRSCERYHTSDRREQAVDHGGPKRVGIAGMVSFSFTKENYNLCLFYRVVLA